MARTSPTMRFLSKVKFNLDPNGCDEWIGSFRTKGRGYGCFRVKGVTMQAHRYAYEQVCGPLPKGACVLHFCDNPRCVKTSHLYAGTHQDNMDDRQSRSRQARGEGHGRARLTERSVRWIRKAHAAGGTSYAKLAPRFGVSRSAIAHVVEFRTWRHV